jgi:hypothetical protein
VLPACSHACGDDGIARLIEETGAVQRDLAAHPGAFTSAAHGATFHSGDGLRTLEHSSARLKLADAGAVLVKSATTIRLWRGQNVHGVRLKVQTGDANVITERDTLEIETELGIAVLQPGSQLRVRPARRGQHYEVTVGHAILTSPDGQKTLGPGEGIDLDMDAASHAASSAARPDGVAPNEAAGVTMDEPAVETITHGASDLVIALGASATIYDPKPPTAIAIDARASCPNGALLSMQGRPATPIETDQVMLLAPGAHDYKLICLDAQGRSTGQSTRGTLHVLHNPGTAQLPSSAPKNSIETDGRTYTIMFQNLLPVLEVRWARAPQAKAYTLTVQLASGRELRVSLDKPSHVFRAGALPEGRHELQFEADRPGAPHSPQTTIDLRYDNASPSASLRAPSSSGFEEGPIVHVAGLALPGSQVTVFGQHLALDAQQRFAGDVALPAGTRALAVRIQHPRTGVRYYLRRSKATP